MSGLGSVAPVDGVRVSLTLDSSTGTQATYSCSIRWNESGLATEVTGSVSVVSEPTQVNTSGLEQAPEGAVAFVRTLCRTIGRGVQDGRWPRRLTRWRDER